MHNLGPCFGCPKTRSLGPAQSLGNIVLCSIAGSSIGFGKRCSSQGGAGRCSGKQQVRAPRYGGRLNEAGGNGLLNRGICSPVARLRATSHCIYLKTLLYVAFRGRQAPDNTSTSLPSRALVLPSTDRLGLCTCILLPADRLIHTAADQAGATKAGRLQGLRTPTTTPAQGPAAQRSACKPLACVLCVKDNLILGKDSLGRTLCLTTFCL